MSHENRIGFAGLSHLGIIYSTAAAAHGFQVLAFDERPGLVEALSSGRLPVAEPGLEEVQREHGERIRYTADVGALAKCRLIFITLDVATDDDNRSDLTPLEALIAKVFECVTADAVVVLMSQVPPGYCRALTSTLPTKLNLLYQVETLVFGDAVQRAMYPERYIIGCSDPRAGLPKVYRHYLERFDCPVLPMRFESAELCKIAINCFLVSSVATANTLAEICENIGADWSEIVPALRLDKRIGPHAYLKPGLGIAGGNLERDLVTMQRLAAENGCNTDVVTAWQRNSAYRKDWVLRRLFRMGLLGGPMETRLAVWGLAYKQDTHSVKNSPSLELLRSLPEYHWQAYDPAATIEASELSNVCVCPSALEAARLADVLIVMTPWQTFASADMEAVLLAMRGRHVLDPYGVLDGNRCRDLGFTYDRLGA